MKVPPRRSENGFLGQRVKDGGVPTRPPPSPPHLQRGLGKASSAQGRIARPRRESGRGTSGTEKRPTPGKKGCRRAGRAPRRSEGRRRAAAQPGTPPQATAGEGPRVLGDRRQLTPRSSSERKSGPSSRPSCGVGGPSTPKGRKGRGKTQRETLAPSPRRPRACRPHRAPRVRRHREHPPSWLLRVQGSRRRTSKATNRAGRAGGGRGRSRAPAPPLARSRRWSCPEGERTQDALHQVRAQKSAQGYSRCSLLASSGSGRPQGHRENGPVPLPRGPLKTCTSTPRKSQ